MIQGTSSNVGKSILVTALCRVYARRGYSVFPFKSQNMALNSFVTPQGLEIGRAQALQAVAAKREVQVEMNPVLLKPEGNRRSQVVVMGKPWKTLQGAEYYTAKEELWKIVTSVLDDACRENDIVVIEGAGSPAEINLKQNEIVNMSIARYLNAPVLLAADIDRGGVFAFLYGTLALLEKEEQELIKGYIINKFRGDIKLLEPGLQMIADLTAGRPTLGVIPYLKNIHLAQEDSVFLDENRTFGDGGTDVVVILLPHISNYDDFDALIMEQGISLRFVEDLRELGTPDAIIIPGTKTTIADLFWLKSTGLASAISQKAAGGVSVAGICGGYQMLGKSLIDEEGVEGTEGQYKGLGLLSHTTVFEREKETLCSTAVLNCRFGSFATVPEARVEGYEIHMGRSLDVPEEAALLRTDRGTLDGAVSADGKIWGTYFHGIFDTVDFRRAWLKSLGWESRGIGRNLKEQREDELEALADIMEEHLDMKLLDRIIGL